MNVARRVALAALAALLLGSCQNAPDTSARAEARLLERSIAAAIGVRAEGCHPNDRLGSGSMIDVDLAITAAHVVAGATGVRVVDADGAPTAAEVVLFDPDLDLALLRTARPVGSPLTVGAPAESGDRGVLVTYRGEGNRRTRVANVVRVVRTVEIDTTDIYLDRPTTRAGFEFRAVIESGDSGGVVVLPEDNAGGMVWAKSTEHPNRAWAVDIPDAVRDQASRRALVDTVDTGGCAP